MYQYLFIFLLLLPLKVFSRIITDNIHSISISHQNNKPHLIKFMNGAALALEQDHESELLLLNEARINGHQVEVRTIGNNIVSMQTLRREPHDRVESVQRHSQKKKWASFGPTVLPSLRFARNIFKSLNPHYHQLSQCYNRAHVWSYEIKEKLGINSQKAFVFFSDDFITKNHFEWWFHVAPLFIVNENGNKVSRVMDHQYSKHPLSPKQWTDIWIKSGKECYSTTKYSDYSQKRGQHDCYLISTSMYYWQPKDLETLEDFNIARTYFFDWEIEHAYQEAFPTVNRNL